MLKSYYSQEPALLEERFHVEDEVSKEILSAARDPVCLNIINPLSQNSPIECTSCQQTYCSRCKEKILSSHTKCPQCREPFIPKKLNRNIKCILETLKLKCQYVLNGCKEVLSFEKIINHEESCEFRSARCTKLCGYAGIFKALESHLQNCPNEMVACKYKPCNVKLIRKDMPTHEKMCIYNSASKAQALADKTILHEEIKAEEIPSPTFPQEKILDKKKINAPLARDIECIKCRYNGCSYNDLKKEVVEFHETHCIFRIDFCPNWVKGCSYTGNRYNIQSHISTNCPFGKARSNSNQHNFQSNRIDLNGMDNRKSARVKSPVAEKSFRHVRRLSNQDNSQGAKNKANMSVIEGKQSYEVRQANEARGYNCPKILKHYHSNKENVVNN